MCIKLRKYTFVSFKTIYCYSKLFLISPYPQDQPKAHMTSLGKFGCAWPRLAKLNQKYNPQSFPSLVNISMQKKSKAMIDSLQWY